MAFQVFGGGVQAGRVITEPPEALVAVAAQDPSDDSRRVAVVDLRALLAPLARTADGAPLVLDEEDFQFLSGQPVRLVASGSGLALRRAVECVPAPLDRDLRAAADARLAAYGPALS